MHWHEVVPVGVSAEGFVAEHRKTLSLRQAVYMSQDRPDSSAAACQLPTRMKEPTEYDWGRLKRMFRYVKGCPRCVVCHPW